MAGQSEIQEIFSGLRVLAESTFPKCCRGCGREYASAEEFIAATRAVRPDCSGLKQSLDDDDQPIVDLFRNCDCGSTLMESFNDRRDPGEAGSRRRRRFAQMLGHLLALGVSREIAYAATRKVQLDSRMAEFEQSPEGGNAPFKIPRCNVRRKQASGPD